MNRLKQSLIWFYLTVVILMTAATFAFNLRLYTPLPAPADEIVAQLHFIRGALDHGAADEAQDFFPEGYFFSYALYGLAWVELGLKQPPLVNQALVEAHWALEHLDSPAGRAVFSVVLDPPYGVFYLGWSSWLRGGILKLQPVSQRDTAEVARFLLDTQALADDFDDSATPFLMAYPGQAWPVDNVVAIASLRLHDQLFQPRFASTIERWLELAQQRLDPVTGLLPHYVNAQTGTLLQGARASSQSIIQRFLPEIDPLWAEQQYDLFRSTFVTTILGIPGIREYPPGVDGSGDVDSGPLIAGISLSATVVTVAAARIHGDSALETPLLQAGEALGFPLALGDTRRYALGLLPIGDAFLAWAKSASPWLYTTPSRSFVPVVAPTWRSPWHLLSVVILILLWWPAWKRRRKSVKSEKKHHE